GAKRRFRLAASARRKKSLASSCSSPPTRRATSLVRSSRWTAAPIPSSDQRIPLQTDIEIAQQARLKPIGEIAARLGIPEEALEPYGRTKGKVSLEWLAQQSGRPNGKLILVSAISPTPAGEGKTTTTVGLGDALNRIGKKAVICLREPSLGPVFGMKGG